MSGLGRSIRPGRSLLEEGEWPFVVLLQCKRPFQGHYLVDSDRGSARDLLFYPFTDEETEPEIELPRVTQLARERLVFKLSMSGS